MVVDYERRKPFDPFRKPFPTKWVLIGILLIIVSFSMMRCMRGEAIVPKERDLPVMENATVAEEIPTEIIPEEEREQHVLTVTDLGEPQFPEVDKELASVI